MRFEPDSDHTRACAQAGADVSRQSAQTFTLRVANLFKRKAGEWIDARELQDVGGRMAWRTRVSDCRTELGMTIENRVRRMRGHQPNCSVMIFPDVCKCGRSVRWTISEYRYTPPAPDGKLF